MIEREIVEPVNLCTPDGRLDRAAVGWSRQPMHRCNLRGRWGRKKRWDYWCVTTTDYMLALTYANIDYIGLATAVFLDFASERWMEKAVVVPLAVGFDQGDTVGGSDISFDRFGLRLSIRESQTGTHLAARFRARSGEDIEAGVEIALPEGHETLSVVVPWSERDFQFTSKHNTRPATGRVVVDGREHPFSPDNDAFGCLDYGRGVWPYRTLWNWGSASGTRDGLTIGLQLGGKWTDGTGSTENAVCIDGRLTKISEELAWIYDAADFTRPWRITAPIANQVDLTFTPFYEKRVKGDAIVLGGELHQCFGHYDGHVVDAAGDRHRIERLLGWAEEVRVRW